MKVLSKLKRREFETPRTDKVYYLGELKNQINI